MRLRLLPLCLLPLGFGCGNLNGGDNDVVALELRLPSQQVLEPGDTIQLRARALDRDGDSVEATIVWLTPDSTISLDSTGLLSTDTTAGTGRVQARVGTLRSNLETFTIRPRSDVVVLTAPTTVTVPTTDSASSALVARVVSVTPPPDTVGISGSSLLYEVVDSATFRDVVHFAGDVMSLRASTGADGAPATGVTLRRNPAATFPATVTVRVSATRPSGAVVPGSGQSFTVTFQ